MSAVVTGPAGIGDPGGTAGPEGPPADRDAGHRDAVRRTAG